jgi:hypothetical protein
MQIHLKKKDPKNLNAPPDLGPDFNFDKLKYVIPASFTQPLMSERSLIK